MLKHLAVAQVHVHTTGEARIEAAHRAHDVNALKIVWSVLLEEGETLHCIFIGCTFCTLFRGSNSFFETGQRQTKAKGLGLAANLLFKGDMSLLHNFS